MSDFCEDEFWLTVDEPQAAFEPPLSAVAVCSRRDGHDDHHCDRVLEVAWLNGTEVECPQAHDHGQPPNRAARRGNTMHPSSARSRADFRPGFARRER